MRGNAWFATLVGLTCTACADPAGPAALDLGAYSAQFSGDVEARVQGVALVRLGVGIVAGEADKMGDLLELNVAPPNAPLSIQMAVLFIDSPRVAEGRFAMTTATDQGPPQQGVFAAFEIETDDGHRAVFAVTSGSIEITDVRPLEVRGIIDGVAERIDNGGGAPDSSRPVSVGSFAPGSVGEPDRGARPQSAPMP